MWTFEIDLVVEDTDIVIAWSSDRPAPRAITHGKKLYVLSTAQLRYPDALLYTEIRTGDLLVLE